jgi:SepF-like predicted cell division protein (DUF552 family)
MNQGNDITATKEDLFKVIEQIEENAIYVEDIQQIANFIYHTKEKFENVLETLKRNNKAFEQNVFAKQEPLPI